MSQLAPHECVPIIDALAGEFTSAFSRAAMAALVTDTAHGYHDADYAALVPTLMQRFARERPLATAQWKDAS